MKLNINLNNRFQDIHELKTDRKTFNSNKQVI